MDTEKDAQREEWYDRLREEFREELRDDIIADFSTERLKSYYAAHKDIDEAPLRALGYARDLLENNATASFIFACIAAEVCVKNLMLRPLVYGLVHQESAAALITELTVGHSGWERFRDLLIHLLREHCGVDLATIRRAGASTSVWQEFNDMMRRRNGVLHRAETVDEQTARMSIAIASGLLERVFPVLIEWLEID